jgi:hypothetical protein
MSKQRTSVFQDAGEIDLSGFSPKGREEGMAPAPEHVKAVAKAANFLSREAASVPARAPKARPARIYRTGRNVQFNAKASLEVVDAIYAIAVKQGWVLGETLERAIAALRRELEAKQ